MNRWPMGLGASCVSLCFLISKVYWDCFEVDWLGVEIVDKVFVFTCMYCHLYLSRGS
jgi:hypothetical protein